MNNTNINLGIDLGGTKIEIAALDFSTNNIIYRKRIPTPQNVYEDTLQAISDLIFETEQKFNFKYGDFPVAEKFYGEEVSLPIFYGLKNSQIKFIISNIKKLIQAWSKRL